MTEAGFLPYGRHAIDEADVAAVAAVLRGDWLTTGPAVAAFEAAFAKRVDAPYAVACANGTAGLHLAALALGLGPGDVGIVPANTFVATANCLRYVGADVVFADVDPDTGLMTADTFDEALRAAGGNRVRAVLPVHFAGQCVEMAALAWRARHHGMSIVEDACHVVGGSYVDADGTESPVGSGRHSDITVFSMHPVKTIAMGEGSVVTTRDPALHASLARLRAHGITRDPSEFRAQDQAFENGDANPWYYEQIDLGFNYRASDVHCALGLSQLSKLDRFVARRAELAALYDAGLRRLAPVVRPLARVAGCRPAWHLYVVLVDFKSAGTTRAKAMRALRARGVGTQVHYIPVHRQPYYRTRPGQRPLPGADAYYDRALTLPLFVGMGDADVGRVVDALAHVLGRAGA